MWLFVLCVVVGFRWSMYWFLAGYKVDFGGYVYEKEQRLEVEGLLYEDPISVPHEWSLSKIIGTFKVN